LDTPVNYITKLDDIESNRLEFDGRLSLKLFEGFGIELSGGYSRIRDQYAIPKSNLSLEELLLQRRELVTQFDYRGAIGFSYTFGLIYNNIVNPRF